MSKYNVGDKFIVEIKAIGTDGTYKVQEGHWFVESIFNSMHKVDSNMKIEDITDMIAEYDTEKKGYNKGLQDAWELVRKIYGMTYPERNEVLGTNFSKSDIWSILDKFPPQEVLARFKAYEKKQAEIKVGDVCKFGEGEVLITKVGNVLCNGFYIKHFYGENGKTGAFEKEKLEKTGKHIDIQAVLQEIGGEA